MAEDYELHIGKVTFNSEQSKAVIELTKKGIKEGKLKCSRCLKVIKEKDNYIFHNGLWHIDCHKKELEEGLL